MKLSASYHREMIAFCKAVSDTQYTKKPATPGAISQARAKLTPWAFQRLRDVIVECFYQKAPYKIWQEYRVLAIDGTVINLPYSKCMIEEFGSEDYMNKSGAPKSMARGSILYDVLNDIIIDAQLQGYKISEKKLFDLHHDKITKKDLIIADRNYGTTYIIQRLEQQGAKFCIRLRNNKWNAVDAFTKSKDQSMLFDLDRSPREYVLMGLPAETTTVKIRLVKVVLDNGGVEILATNLFDEEKYPLSIFKELYFLRWPVEEAYKLLKVRLDLESFSARTAIGIQQDFHAKILLINLSSALSHPISEKIRTKYNAEQRGNKYDQQLNKTDAIAETKSRLIDLFIKKVKKKILNEIDEIIFKSRTIIRPGRNNIRLAIVKKRKPMNYKHL